MKKIVLLLITLQALPLMGMAPTRANLNEGPTNGALVVHSNPNPVPTNCWEALGLSRFFASEEDINRAFNQLLRQHRVHPDQGGTGEAFRNLRAAQTQALQELASRKKFFKNMFEGFTFASAVASLMVASAWYTQLSPYKSFLQIDAQGIATQDKQIPWSRIHTIQPRDYGYTNNFLDIVYAKPDNVRGILTIKTADLPCSEEQFLNLLVTYKKKNTNPKPPIFSTRPFTKGQLQHIRKNGFYTDEQVALICRAKFSWLTLTGLSLLAGGALAGSLYQLNKIKIPQIA
jgi:hypothetical protein